MEEQTGSPLHFSYLQRGGRSGHALKDLFTSVILAELIGGRALFNPSWRRQNLLPIRSARRALGKRLESYRQICEINEKSKAFGGVPFEDFECLREEIRTAQSDAEGGSLLIRIKRVFRIHLFQVNNWEHRGLVKAGSYGRLLKTLRSMYWGAESPPEPSSEPRRIAIHARRGDVANPRSRGRNFKTMGPGGVWNADFYQKCIDGLVSEFPEAEITVYSEPKNSGDLLALRGTALELGGRDALADHFRRLVSTDVLVPACSSFSTWASYLCRGRVRIYHPGKIKHFDHNPLPPNFELGGV